MSREIFLDKGVMLILEIDPDGNILYVNSDFCKLSRYSKDEIIGMHYNDLKHNDTPEYVLNDQLKSIKNGEKSHKIVKIKTKDENYYWSKESIFPSIDAAKSVRYICINIKASQDEIQSAKKEYEILDSELEK